MKFALISDVHLHFGPLELQNEEGAECLILAGDVYEAINLPDHAREENWISQFFLNCAKEFKHVIWVAGNHEFYGSTLAWGESKIRNWLKENPNLSNITYLQNESLRIGDVHIHGGTLWTNLDKGNPLSINRVVNGMNDFVAIESHTAFSMMKEHENTLDYFSKNIIKGQKNIVVTHHHPTYIGVDPRFQADDLNHGYCSDLSEFIFQYPDINVWCCGHIHRSSDYLMYNTRVLCNPRGYYRHESIAEIFKLKYFKV